jgi:hypothetical protein
MNPGFLSIPIEEETVGCLEVLLSVDYIKVLKKMDLNEAELLAIQLLAGGTPAPAPTPVKKGYVCKVRKMGNELFIHVRACAGRVRNLPCLTQESSVNFNYI